MTTNPIDVALQASAPTVMVPKFGAFEPLQANGHRFLMASNGLWLEVRRPWAYVREKLADSPVATPYGVVTECRELAFAGIPGEILGAFIDQAREAMPNEAGAWIVWHPERGFRLQRLNPEQAGPGHLRYHQPTLREGEWQVADIHSHAEAGAFFSRTDNQDDKHCFKLAIVVGNINGEISMKTRWCLLGKFVPFQKEVS